MDTSISFVGVLLATLSTFVVGSIWYSPSLFLTPWMKIVGADSEHMKRIFGKSMAYIFASSIVTAYVMAHFINYTVQATGVTGVSAGLQTAFWLWLGLALTTIVANGAMDTRAPKIMLIQAGNRLVTLLVMGWILGVFK